MKKKFHNLGVVKFKKKLIDMSVKQYYLYYQKYKHKKEELFIKIK